MKKFLAVLLAVLMLVTLVACSKDEDEGGSGIEANANDNVFSNNDGLGSFTYEVNENGHYDITGYKTTSSANHAITIPAVIEDIAVTGIAAEAFKSCTSLTAVTIPDSVLKIGDYAFAACTQITEIAVPEGVTELGIGVFSDCTALTKVTLPTTVKEIPEQTFWGCKALATVNIDANVTSIGNGAFWDCDALTSVSVPSSVTSIGDVAFYSCDALTKIEVANAEVVIGEAAFARSKSEKLEFVVDAGSTAETYFNKNYNNDSYTNYHLLIEYLASSN